MRTISATVGRASRNDLRDVVTVQELLNNVSPGEGGPAPKLVVDGLCGPKTQHAIQTFQLKHFGFSGADGRVEPGKQTLAKLNEINERQNPISPPPALPVPELFPSFVFRQAGKPGTIMSSNADFFFHVMGFENGTARREERLFWLGPPQGFRRVAERPTIANRDPFEILHLTPPGFSLPDLDNSPGFCTTRAAGGKLNSALVVFVRKGSMARELRVPLRRHLTADTRPATITSSGFFQLV
jgi:hypothetical protein